MARFHAVYKTNAQYLKYLATVGVMAAERETKRPARRIELTKLIQTCLRGIPVEPVPPQGASPADVKAGDDLARLWFRFGELSDVEDSDRIWYVGIIRGCSAHKSPCSYGVYFFFLLYLNFSSRAFENSARMNPAYRPPYGRLSVLYSNTQNWVKALDGMIYPMICIESFQLVMLFSSFFSPCPQPIDMLCWGRPMHLKNQILFRRNFFLSITCSWISPVD